MPTAKELLNAKRSDKPPAPPKQPPAATSSTPRKPRTNTYKQFIENYKDILIKALYNARNTIRGKKEVKEQDTSKQYYRDFLKYEEIIEKLKKLGGK
jgi:hypothetical protein